MIHDNNGNIIRADTHALTGKMCFCLVSLLSMFFAGGCLLVDCTHGSKREECPICSNVAEMRRTIDPTLPWDAQGLYGDIHSCDKNKWAPFAEIARILDFNDIWPSYRKADGSDARQTCIIADAENDSATVYLRNTAASSFKNTEAIWVIYESSRIILLVSGGLASEPSECQVSDEMENDDDWTPMSPNCKVVVANVKGRPIFLSDGYKLLRLE